MQRTSCKNAGPGSWVHGLDSQQSQAAGNLGKSWKSMLTWRKRSVNISAEIYLCNCDIPHLSFLFFWWGSGCVKKTWKHATIWVLPRYHILCIYIYICIYIDMYMYIFIWYDYDMIMIWLWYDYDMITIYAYLYIHNIEPDPLSPKRYFNKMCNGRHRNTLARYPYSRFVNYEVDLDGRDINENVSKYSKPNRYSIVVVWMVHVHTCYPTAFYQHLKEVEATQERCYSSCQLLTR